MKVAVVGSGIVGLWTADVLSARGYAVTVHAASLSAMSTSAAAVAVVTPLFPGQPTDAVFQKSMRWYDQTLSKLRSVESGRFIEMIPATEFGVSVEGRRFLEKDFQAEKLEDVGLEVEWLNVDPSIVVENHVNEFNTVTFGARFQTPLCNSEVFLPWVISELRRRGVAFERTLVSCLEDFRRLNADIVVNCMGHGVADLFEDQGLWFVRGQSMFVPGLHDPKLCFGIAAGNHAVFKHRRGFYIGSFFLEGSGRARTVPHEAEYQLSLRFVRDAYPQLLKAAGYALPGIDFKRISQVNTGIRPFRSGGPRVELELLRGDLPVVHNYGHGAHGWTVGYGTALDAAALVESIGI